MLFRTCCVAFRRGKSQVHRLPSSAMVGHHAVPSDSPRASAAGGGGGDNKLQLDEEHLPQHPRALELVRVSGGASRLQRLSQSGSGWSSDSSRQTNGLTNGYHAAAQPTVEHVDRCEFSCDMVPVHGACCEPQGGHYENTVHRRGLQNTCNNNGLCFTVARRSKPNKELYCSGSSASATRRRPG